MVKKQMLELINFSGPQVMEVMQLLMTQKEEVHYVHTASKGL